VGRRFEKELPMCDQRCLTVFRHAPYAGLRLMIEGRELAFLMF
jgi:hypothetical protein